MAKKVTGTVMLKAEDARAISNRLMKPDDDDMIKDFEITIENAYPLPQPNDQANVIAIITAKTRELFDSFVEFLKGLSEVTYAKGYATMT